MGPICLCKEQLPPSVANENYSHLVMKGGAHLFILCHLAYRFPSSVQHGGVLPKVIRQVLSTPQ